MGGVEKKERQLLQKIQKALVSIHVLIGRGPRHIMFYPHALIVLVCTVNQRWKKVCFGTYQM